MDARGRLSVRGAAFLVAAALLPGCTLFLYRNLGIEGSIERGSVIGRLVRSDENNQPAPFARVTIAGAVRAVRADSQGNFAVRGLTEGSWALRIDDDPDGDGWPDRSLARGVRVALLAHSSSPLETLTGAAAEPEPTGVVLGDVALEKTGAVRGRVTFNGGPLPTGLIGRVFATRHLRIEAPDLDNAEIFALGAEASTHVDASGDFYFGGLGSGEVRLIALLYANDGGRLGELRQVSDVGIVTLQPRLDPADPPSDAEDLDVTGGADLPLEEQTNVALALTPAPTGGEMYVVLVPPGREFPSCEVDPIPSSYAGSGFDYALVVPVETPQATVNLSVPLGAWDLQVCDGVLPGELRGQVATRGEGSPLWGPIFLGAALDRCSSWVASPSGETCNEGEGCTSGEGVEVSCRATGVRDPITNQPERACFVLLENDCDGDGLPGLPLYEGDAELWDITCSTSCTGTQGEDLEPSVLEDTTCTAPLEGDQVSAILYDCDDDGDGQADVNEPACYGPGLGTDLDNDGICSPQDGYPLCADNDPVLCDAERNDAAPREGPTQLTLMLASEWGEEGRGELVVPGGSGEAWATSMVRADDGSGNAYAVGFAMEFDSFLGVNVPVPAVWFLPSGATDFEPGRLVESTTGVPMDAAWKAAQIEAAAWVPASGDPGSVPHLLLAGAQRADPFGVSSNVGLHATLWTVDLGVQGELPGSLAQSFFPPLLDYPGGDAVSYDSNYLDTAARGIVVSAANPADPIVTFSGNYAGTDRVGLWRPAGQGSWPAPSTTAVSFPAGVNQGLAQRVLLDEENGVLYVATSADSGTGSASAHLLGFDAGTGLPLESSLVFDNPPGLVFYEGVSGEMQDLSIIEAGNGERRLVAVGWHEPAGEEPGKRPAIWLFDLGGVASLERPIELGDALAGRAEGLLTTVVVRNADSLLVGGTVFDGDASFDGAAWLINLDPDLAAGEGEVVGPQVAEEIVTGGTGNEVLFDSLRLSQNEFLFVGTREFGFDPTQPTGAESGVVYRFRVGAEPVADPSSPCDVSACTVECGGSGLGCLLPTGECECVSEICAGLWTYQGTITTYSDTNLLEGAECVDGSIDLSGPETMDSNLDAVVRLQAISGSLSLSSTEGATDLDFDSLLQVGGSVSFIDNQSLRTLAFGRTDEIAGSLTVDGNPALTSLVLGSTGALGVTRLFGERIQITDNPSLCQTEVAGLGVAIIEGAEISNSGNRCAAPCDGTCDSLNPEGEPLVCDTMVPGSPMMGVCLLNGF